MIQEETHLARILEADSGIDAGYRHVPKHVTLDESLHRDGAVLKCTASTLTAALSG